MQNTKTYIIKGMHCASCAGIIEKTLKRTDGVYSVEVNYGTEKVKISLDEMRTNPQDLSKKIEPLGYSLVINSENKSAKEMNMTEDEHKAHLGIDQSKAEKLAEIREMRNKVISAIDNFMNNFRFIFLLRDYFIKNKC